MPLKAFKVTDGREERSVLVLAEKRSQAIASAIGELDCEYRDARAVRAPEFDDGIPSWRALVEEHGWWYGCDGCHANVSEGDLADGGCFSDDETAWCRTCGPKHTQILQDRLDDAAAEAAMKTEYAAQAKAKWPFVEVVHVHVQLRPTGEFLPPAEGTETWRLPPRPVEIYRKSPLVSVTAPGCRWAITWEPLLDPKHVQVAPEDVETWTLLVSPGAVS